MAVGTGFKWLRIYDSRGASRPLSVVAHNKGVHGVQFDPFNSNRLATFSDDGIIKLWDIRLLRSSTPLMSVHTSGRSSKQRSLLQINWCPTRPGYLGTIFKDDSVLRLWDLSGAMSLLDQREINPNVDPNSVSAGQPLRKHRAVGPLLCTSWHPTVAQVWALCMNDWWNPPLSHCSNWASLLT